MDPPKLQNLATCPGARSRPPDPKRPAPLDALQALRSPSPRAGDPAYASALEACLRDPDGAVAATNANTILDVLADDDDVNLSRRERIESLAREAVHRGKIDSERLDRDEKILGMVLHNRQVEV